MSCLLVVLHFTQVTFPITTVISQSWHHFVMHTVTWLLITCIRVVVTQRGTLMTLLLGMRRFISFLMENQSPIGRQSQVTLLPVVTPVVLHQYPKRHRAFTFVSTGLKWLVVSRLMVSSVDLDNSSFL